MNPFELTKDPDGGGITVRVKHGFVVLTCEEERRVTERITEILAENAKLRDELDKWERLTANIEIPSYPITEFRPKDLERENDKLRKLAKNLKACNSSCGRCIELYGSCDYETELRELRVEVNV